MTGQEGGGLTVPPAGRRCERKACHPVTAGRLDPGAGREPPQPRGTAGGCPQRAALASEAPAGSHTCLSGRRGAGADAGLSALPRSDVHGMPARGAVPLFHRSDTRRGDPEDGRTQP